jgi:hypothetical protein
MVVTADWARRQGENVSLSEVDWNLFNRYLGTPTPAPVIPLCTKSPDFDPTHACSTGGITFWTDQGRAVYDGLLVKLNKRFSNRYQFLASYAFQKGLDETVVDDANYMKGYGEYLPHHQLQVSGTVDMPWGFVLSLNSSIISRTPQTASVNGLFLPGTVPHQSVTGTITTPLPDLGYGCLAAGCSKADLQKAVDAYNANVVGTKDAKGNLISAPLALPSDYQFGDPTITQDFRLTKTFTFKDRYRVSILGELFNAFNIANLTYPASAFTLDNKGATPAFGQPTQRVNQTFGSAGPRALQVGARFTF